MNRRRFIGTALIAATGSALGSTLGSTPARAFAVVDCGSNSPEEGCRELVQHRTQLQMAEQALADKGIPPEERQKILAAATCPLCGQPLVVSGSGLF